jgi:hypothetical protein
MSMEGDRGGGDPVKHALFALFLVGLALIYVGAALAQVDGGLSLMLIFVGIWAAIAAIAIGVFSFMARELFGLP